MEREDTSSPYGRTSYHDFLTMFVGDQFKGLRKICCRSRNRAVAVEEVMAIELLGNVATGRIGIVADYST